MRSPFVAGVGVVATLALAAGAGADPAVVQTEFLGPLTGADAPPDPANTAPQKAAYYGTDLGFSYAHRGRLQFLFGDSWASDEPYAPIEASSGARFDDMFGSIGLADWPDPTRIGPGHVPTVRLGQNAGTTEVSAIDPGHAMDLGKTPMGGFSNGRREFGIFNLTKGQGCRRDADCGNGMRCDATLGYFGAPYSKEELLTLPCRDGSPGCTADTMTDAAGKPVPDSGFCIDETSTLKGDHISNLLGPLALRVRIALRDEKEPKKYVEPHDWLTHKFMNVTVRTGDPLGDGMRRVLLWGRPGFVGVKANGRALGLYFAYVELPDGPGYEWKPRYFAGSENGEPRWSTSEQDAVPLDLDSTAPGDQPVEAIDIVNQMSVAWVEPLGKWVMFYGGGLSTLPTQALPHCGVLELFTGGECQDVDVGNGAVRMRTANHPWGPWSPPQDVIVADPAAGARGPYGPGGPLRHPDCKAASCAPHSKIFVYQAGEYGFFYAANIIEEWIRPVDGGADILWNASTWDPYRVVLMRTRIRNLPTVAGTTILGPFTGEGAPRHPANLVPQPMEYYGTDLGWSYRHGGRIQFLFGDTAATESGENIEASSHGLYDDAFGSIDLTDWPDPARITPDHVPPIRLGQNPGTNEVSAIHLGRAMESFKTPLGGFSNGRREFGLFYDSKPRGCRTDADCGAELDCDAGLGFIGERWDDDKGLTFACIDGSRACNAATIASGEGGDVAASGFCVDRTSSAFADTAVGRVSSAAVLNLVGVRSEKDPRVYLDLWDWLTSKFSNVAVRTVDDFVPARGAGRAHQDYRTAGDGANRRVFLWGRPGFVGVKARSRSLGLYFAYADLPQEADPGLQVHYFSGTDANGIPQFSPHERDAVAVDLDATLPGVQPAEAHDIVDQMSFSWVEPLGKWVMFYGGGMINLPTPELPNCGVLELFAREECKDVIIGDGPIRMRTADDPWGPWSPAQDVLAGGDPGKSPPEGLYGPGGMLRHPDCTAGTCAPSTDWRGLNPREYGFLYGASIIEPWTRPAGDGVDVTWNFSTWDPYRIVLARTHIRR